MEYSPLVYVLPLIAGIVAGVVNTLAGGASIFTLSTLLFFDVPVNLTNGTDRLGILVQNLAGTYSFYKQGLLKVKEIRFVLSSLVGAVIGAIVAVDIDEDVMETAIGLLMTGVACSRAGNRQLGYREVCCKAPQS